MIFEKICIVSLILCFLSTTVCDAREISAISINTNNNEVIFSQNANTRIYPASITKVLSLYILLHNIKQNRIGLFDDFTASEYATLQPKAKIGFKIGEQISVKDLLLMTSTSSANDAITVLAEGAYNENDKFVEEMNRYASEMFMNNSHFINSHGLHDNDHYTSVGDLAVLTHRFIVDFPEYIGLFGAEAYVYKGEIQKTTSDIGKSYKCVNFTKTGYTNQAGFTLSTNLACDKYGVIAVIAGFNSSEERTKYMANLLNHSIKEIDTGGVSGMPSDRFYTIQDNFKQSFMVYQVLDLYHKIIQTSITKDTNNFIAFGLNTIYEHYLKKNADSIIAGLYPLPKSRKRSG